MGVSRGPCGPPTPARGDWVAFRARSLACTLASGPCGSDRVPLTVAVGVCTLPTVAGTDGCGGTGAPRRVLVKRLEQTHQKSPGPRALG